jgi:hypothetical protein
MSNHVADFLREAGYTKTAEKIENVSPEQEQAFDRWLKDPENKARWDAALHAHRTRWCSPTVLLPEILDEEVRSFLEPDLRERGES